MSDKDIFAGAPRPAPIKLTVQPPRRSNAASTVSIKERAGKLKTGALQLMAVAEKAKGIHLECNQEKIYYAWLRGKKPRQLAKEYKIYVDNVDEITRKFAGAAAAQPCRSGSHRRLERLRGAKHVV